MCSRKRDTGLGAHARPTLLAGCFCGWQVWMLVRDRCAAAGRHQSQPACRGGQRLGHCPGALRLPRMAPQLGRGLACIPPPARTFVRNPLFATLCSYLFFCFHWCEQAEFRRPAVQTCNSVSTVTNLVCDGGRGLPCLCACACAVQPVRRRGVDGVCVPGHGCWGRSFPSRAEQACQAMARHLPAPAPLKTQSSALVARLLPFSPTAGAAAGVGQPHRLPPRTLPAAQGLGCSGRGGTPAATGLGWSVKDRRCLDL